MKVLASLPVILFMVVAVARYIVPLVSFFSCIDSKLFLFGMCETGVIASLEAGCSA